MKKLVLLIAVTMMFVLSASAVFAGEFKAPGGVPYGVLEDGTYFISADLVKAAEGKAPKLLSGAKGLDWKPKSVKLVEGGFYIYESGKKTNFGVFCFDIGGGQYIPHALQGNPAINWDAHVRTNHQGGYNFEMKAVK